jgi:diguanylate cyclase (GGDEF)-like protein/PAS domain S-box-containing protein
MLRVLNCLTTEHDWRLVVLAGVVCFFASVAAVNLFHRARQTQDRARVTWLITAGAATGCGIWATHFIAMLAYNPGLPIAYDVGLSVLSLLAAIAVTGVGLMGAVYGPRPWAAPAGGAFVGFGIACMHYTGMWAVQLPGMVEWVPGLVLASIALGMVFGALALVAAVRRDDVGGTLVAAVLLTLAIISHHFTAMGAVEILADPSRVIDAFTLSPMALALAVANAAIAILGMSLGGAFADRRLREQNMRLDTAINNMSQGLLMFDEGARLVICNRRYLQIYSLSEQQVKPGCTLRQLIAHRLQNRTYSGGEPEQYMAELRSAMAEGRVANKLTELPDGRTIAVTSRPMAGGGWVATHEDITEQKQAEKALAAARAEAERAEQEARAAHHRLLEAFEAVPEALVLFDAEDRYVLWNRRYGEMYPHHHRIRKGMQFEESLRLGIAQGQHPEAKGREEEWLAKRMALHRQEHSSHEQQLADGRWIRVEERRTADGGSIGSRVDITELKLREASFRLLFESNPIPMWLYEHATLRFIAVNEAAIEHYGYSREQFLAMTLLDIRPPDDRDEVRRVADTPQTDDRLGRTWRHLKADATEIQVAVFSQPLVYEGRQASIDAVVDLTKRKEAEDDLRRTREFLNTVVENVPALLVVKEAREQRYVLVNREAEEFYGIPREQLIGKTAYEIFPKEQADIMTARDRGVLRSGVPMLIENNPIQTPRRGARLVTSRRLAIRDERGDPQYLLTVIEDVTERRRAEERIAHLAHHDALTDLPNRTAFAERLAMTLEQAGRANGSFALLCIDLDRLKEVNDIFGHAAGDALLREVTRRLRHAVDGAFLARVGGDEFTVLATDGAQPAAAEALAERLLVAVADDVDVGGHRVRTNLSIGVAIYPADGSDGTALLANADAALYRAKQEGRGTIRFFESDMDKRLRERRALQHDLRSAVENGELTLHYQPQALIGGEIVGFEALLRWHHPSRGNVPPNVFIPLAEESGLIIAIGEWVLREACREAASWPRPLHIAVNLSPIQFRHGDLAGLVHSILLETGLSAGRLELEITEGVLIGDFSRAVSILRRLKAVGVRIAMDDFGAGYSSLSYLQSFPFDTIKIDRAFISNVDCNPQSAAIVRAVIGLARGLSVPVVAEGVETRDQLAFLAREACDEVQGYLVGKPAPIETYAEIVGRQATVKPVPAHAG